MAYGFDAGGFFKAPAIGGSLPFGGGGGGGVGGAASGNPGAIAADYNAAYNNALQMNQANYNNILQGYQQAVSAQTSAQAAIQSGYNDLYNDVMGKLQGQGNASAHRINDASSQFLSAQTQSQIDRGLGNTTITTSTARGVEADRQQRLNENDESVAKMMADYMSNLGTGRLQNAARGQEAITGLGLRQLDFMNSVQSKYPDAGMYAQLAQSAAANQAGRGAGGGGYGGGSFGGAGGAAPKLGYVPGPGPYYGGGGYTPAASTGGGSWMASQYAAPSSFGGGYGGGGDFGGLPGGYSQADYGGGGDFGGSDYDYGGGGDF